MTDPSTLLDGTAAATLACPYAAGCHFPRLADPAGSDRVLRRVFCCTEWAACSVFALRAHGHEVSACLWPDGEVKAVEESMWGGERPFSRDR